MACDISLRELGMLADCVAVCRALIRMRVLMQALVYAHRMQEP
jgi:hypothetical protein